MKLQFKVQQYQTEAVVDVFAGQPFADGVKYRIDPGTSRQGAGRNFFLAGRLR